MRGELAALLLAEAERRGIRVLFGRRLAGAEQPGVACSRGSPTAARSTATC